MRRPLLAAGLLAAVTAAVAQPPQNLLPQPRLNTVFPLGAKAGSSLDLTVGGTDLDEPAALLFSHPGLTGTYTPPAEPEPPKDAKKKDAQPNPKSKKLPPPTAAVFQVKVAADVPPGLYDVRVVSRHGVSNPRLFTVGTWPEAVEKEPNDDVDKAQKVELNSVVSGVISSATDVDYYAFTGKAKQRVLVHCASGPLDGKARPWVEVYSPDGRTRLAENRNYNDGEALADVTLPADGEYFVRLTEFAHTAGGPDYFYRLSVGTGPWIDAVFPPAVEPGKSATVTVYGRNLPGGKPADGMTVDGRPVEQLSVTVNAPAAGTLTPAGRVAPPTGLLDSFAFSLPGSNAVPVFLATAPVVLEKDPGNDKADTAQPVPVPCEVAGRIDRRGDADWFAFPAKKGEPLMIELFADRLGSPVDAALVVRNPANKQEIANDGTLDDDPDALHPTAFYTRSADPPAFRFVPPADGTYQVRVGTQASVDSGPRCGYRLRIAPPKPDFRAVAMARSRELPTAPVVRPDGQTAVDVFVQRLDGFTGPLTVTAEKLPPGVTAAPALIGTGQRWGTLVLTGNPELKDSTADITVKVSATIDGKSASHTARPASLTWALVGQNNAPLVARLDRALTVATRGGKPPFRLDPNPAAATVKTGGKDEKAKAPFVLRPGDKLTVPVKVVWQEADARDKPLQLSAEATQPNMGQAPVTVNNGQPLTVAKDKAETPVTIDVRANAAPGKYAVVLRGETQAKTAARDPAGKDKKELTVQAFAAPIEVLVVPTSLGKLAAKQPAPVKVGAAGELVVSVERQFEFAGEFKLTVELPKGTAGLTAEGGAIPAGATEAKLKLTAAKDAKPTTVQNVVVKAVALFDGKYETVHETKVNLTVSK